MFSRARQLVCPGESRQRGVCVGSVGPGWSCGLSAPMVLRGRAREVLSEKPERGVSLDSLLPGQGLLEAEMLWITRHHWLLGKTS